MYGRCFANRWEEYEEIKPMNKSEIFYRVWGDNDKTIKGFYVNLFTQALNSTRKTKLGLKGEQHKK